MQEYIGRYRNRYPPRPLAEGILQASKNKTNSLPSGTGSTGLTGGQRRPTVAKAAGGPGRASRIPTYQEYIRIYIYICRNIYEYLGIYGNIYICTQEYMNIYTYMNISQQIGIHIYIYISMYIYIFIYKCKNVYECLGI